jgi:hypothetical protein
MRKFQQSTPFGRTLFCSSECLKQAHSEQASAKQYHLVCDQCGRSFKGNKTQRLRKSRGHDVCCSFRCRAMRNSGLRRAVLKKIVSPETQP